MSRVRRARTDLVPVGYQGGPGAGGESRDASICSEDGSDPGDRGEAMHEELIKMPDRVEAVIESHQERVILDAFDDGPTKAELRTLRRLRKRRRGDLPHERVH